MKYAQRKAEPLKEWKTSTRKLMNPRWREKLLWSKKAPVPQTDTGRRGENPKTSGRTLVKELGKMTP